MTMPHVSVIMNCLNCARDLPAALESLRKQSFQDFEIIFWDNCSTDASASLAQSYGENLRYFRGSATVPLGAARNLALAQARGTLIAFLDCDDMWLPGKLAAQVALFEANPRLGLACTDTEIYDGRRTGKRTFASNTPERGMAFSALVQRQWISMSSAMLRSEALAALSAQGLAPGAGSNGHWFDESLNVCEEADVFYRIAHDWEIDFVDEVLTLWRVHGRNTTFCKFDQFAAETLHILAKHRKLYPGYDQQHADLVQLLSHRAAFQQAVSLWSNGKNAAARQAIRPWRHVSKKYRLFCCLTYLPGSFFQLCARLYFSLPAFLRR